MSDWNAIIQRHEDLKELITMETPAKIKLSELAGTLSKETAADMLKYVEEGRIEWEERLKKQF